MKFQIQKNEEKLSGYLQQFFQIQEYKNILDFTVTEVDLSQDISAEKNRIDLQNYTYMIQPLQYATIEQGKRKELVFSAPEQMGKTTVEMLAILYNIVYNSLQAIIVYPSQELAVETSNVKFIPLFRKIKQIQNDLNKPFAIRSDRLKLSNAVIYWQGAGSKIVSKSAKLVLGDQCSIWETPNNINNIEQLKKRTRSYSECLQIFVSTPRYKEDPFWQQFLNGSQGYYYLRCMNCRQLTIRSCDIHNLQFDSEYNQDMKLYQVIPGTCRLVCPVCGYEHTEDYKKQMIQKGGYKHKFPQKKELYSTFQVGVLASHLNVHCYDNLADIQLASGKTASLESYISYDNSIRGLPYQQRSYNKQDQTALSKHFFDSKELKKDDIQAIYLVADTQDTFSVLATFALTKQNNFYLMRLERLRYLFLQDQERKIINQENHRNNKQNQITVLDRLDQFYFGDIKPLMLLVDMRGHRTEQIKNFCKIQKNILMYAGTNLKYDLWKISENNRKLFLCDSKKFQAETIFSLYYQNNKQNNYLFLTDTLTNQDIEQITSFQPDNEKRNGNLYENWTCKDKVHDVFDCIKMFFASLKISAKIYKKEKFRIGEAQIIQKSNKPIKQKNLTKTQNKKSFFIR